MYRGKTKERKNVENIKEEVFGIQESLTREMQNMCMRIDASSVCVVMLALFAFNLPREVATIQKQVKSIGHFILFFYVISITHFQYSYVLYLP